jgi:hypothetical protein
MYNHMYCMSLKGVCAQSLACNPLLKAWQRTLLSLLQPPNHLLVNLEAAAERCNWLRLA